MSQYKHGRIARSRFLAVAMLLGFVWTGSNLGAQSQKGADAIDAGDYERAIAIFKAAVQRDHEQDLLADSYWLGYAYYRSGRLPEAIAAFRAALEHREQSRHPNVFDYTLDSYAGSARACFESKQYSEAASAFLNAAMLAVQMSGINVSLQDKPASYVPRAADYYASAGTAYWENKNYQEAMSAYKKAIELNPQSGQYYSELAVAYTGSKQYDDALVAAKKGVEFAPNARYSYQILGNVYSDRKQYSQAIDAYRQAEGLPPDDLQVHYRLGWVYERTGRFAEAIASFDKAIGLATYVGIGIQHRIVDGEPVVQMVAEGPAKEAGLVVGDTLVRLDGQRTKGRDENWLTQSLRGAENTQVVVTVQRQGEARPFDRTITRRRIVPKTAAPYYEGRSLCAREMGNREGAVRDAELAYALDPEDDSARDALAAMDLDRGKYDEAVTLLSLVKDDPFSRLLEATVYAKQSDFNRAVAVYLAIPEEERSATALRQHARTTLLQALRGYVEPRLDKAKAAESAGQFVEALAEYSEAVQVADDATAGSIRQRVATLLKDHPYLAELPEEARKYALRGEVHIKDGRFDDALKEYRTALGVAPFNPKLHHDAALICDQLKEYRQAIAYMAVYLQLSPDAPDARAAKDQVYKWELALEQEGKR
jgi:tetratricopeptide (TPR) repeat protein